MRLALLAMVTLLGLAACSTGQPGVKNRMGTITATFAATPEQVAQAAVDTIEDMDLILISHEATAVDARVVARTARDDSITINVEQAGENVSNVGIRVGTFGDEAMSLTILDRIRSEIP